MRPRSASDDATAAPPAPAESVPVSARIDEVTFDTLFEGSPVGMCLVGMDGRPLRCNPAMTALLGYTEAELRAMSFVDFTHPDDLPAELAQYQEMLDGRRTFGQLEKRYRRKDGALVWVRVTVSLVPEPEGPARFAVGMIEDIQERKATEDRLAAVLTSIGDHLVSYDHEWRYTFVNDGAERVLGRPRQELLGRSIWELFPEAVGNAYWDELHRAQAERQVRRFEHYYPPHGTWYENHIYPMADGVTVLAADVTRRKQAEAAARASEERYRNLFEDSPVSLWEQDFSAVKARVDALRAAGVADLGAHLAAHPDELRACLDAVRTIEVNQATLRLFGAPDKSALIGGPGAVTPPEALAAFAAELVTFAAGETRYQAEVPRRRLDGAPLLVDLCARVAPGAETTWERVLVSIVDVAERKASEQALREADRRKDEFLAVLAHELRNPLAPLRSATELLRLVGDGPMRDQALGVLERQLAHMVRLIDDLLDVSRISRGRIELKRAPVDLAAVIGAAIETSRPQLEAGKHVLESALAPGLVVDGDATRLAQVFANLLNNAAKFTPAGGHVHVSAERDGDAARVTVRDDGIGIPAETLPRVFEMFAQGERSLEQSRGGLGIGLTLARRLVQLHGGDIEARSEGPGRGSAFVVRLPLATAAAAATSVAAPAEPRTAPTTRRILVADDNEDAAASLALMLRLMGHDTRTARDGAEALELAESFVPDVLLLDIGMPRLNGYDVARRVRALRGDAVRLVALTGWGQESDRRRSKEAGFDEHLVKPVDVDRLVRLLGDTPPA